MRFPLSAGWRSPSGQPAWARPTLVALTGVAGFFYSWDATGNLEVYYAAADRSMSMSWHDFFFAAFDPAGTVTLDKLPGAFWVQALAVRLFGVHPWALVAPQIVEGMASILVLYHVVRRLAGPLAAIAAAAILVLSPATVALNRGNISDTLMVLLLILAVDATVSAVVSGWARYVILGGLFVGLAFQAKMIEAWLVVPALALAYLVAGSGGWRWRLPQLAATGLIAGAVSLSWMVVVSIWPPSGRPYVDGSQENSIFSQVFVYNGFGRLDQASPNELLTKAIGLHVVSSPPGWNRLLTGSDGRDVGWLIPAAVIALVAGLMVSRRGARSDLQRAGTVLWGTWLIVFLVAFSAGSTINAYYTAALSPAIAALVGTGLAHAWELRSRARARWTLAAAVATTGAYAAWLLPGRGVGLVAGLPEAAAVFGLAAIGLLLIRAPASGRPGAFALAAVAVVTVPAAASVSVVAKGFGPFDTPFETAASSQMARLLGGVAKQVVPLLGPLEQAKGGQPILMATQTAALAAPFIWDSGQEVLPIGGFTGTIPEPKLADLQSMISAGDFHIVVQAPKVDDSRLVWVAGHCVAISKGTGVSTTPGGLPFSVYFCGRLR